ncbi:MAG TPA: hypothetical protein VH186_13870 [Chloroflexia bacterium]|nr:hypothetical protein [Chloroflexia bacterium]
MKKKLTVIGLLLAGLLTACGDSPTATPAPTTAAATTVASTTAAATATTSSGGSAATAGPTVAGGVATTAANVSTAVVPSISGTTEIQLDTSFLTEFLKQVPVGSNATVHAYVSDDDPAKVAGNTDTALKGAGYQFGLPGFTAPITQGDSTLGLYSKTGTQDILFATIKIPTAEADLQNFNAPGVSQEAIQKFISQVKGKNTMLLVVTAPNLLQTLISASTQTGGLSGGSTSTTPGASTTAAPTLTTPAGTTTP